MSRSAAAAAPPTRLSPAHNQKPTGFSSLVSPQQEDCEKAYFKMDNVLIDDRRIHVDFSQSVAKIRWKGKGRRQRRRPLPRGFITLG